MHKSVKWILLDIAFVLPFWVAFYYFNAGALPEIQRGIIGLIALLVLFQWLFGSYSLLSRKKPKFLKRFQYVILSLTGALLVYTLFYLVTDFYYDSSHMKRVIWPLFLACLASGLFISIIARFQYAVVPQSRWLLIVNRQERDLVTQEILATGMALPAALEWRSSTTKTSIPPQLVDLLGLQGVVIGSGFEINSLDAQTLIEWQRRGIEINSLRSWFANHFMRIPTELLPMCNSDLELFFSVNRLQHRLRLKRLLDLILLLPFTIFAFIGLFILVPFIVVFRRKKIYPLNEKFLSSTKSIGLDGKCFARYRFNSPNVFIYPLSSIPQLLNIWRGEMSFVGPRPVTQQLQAQLERIDPYYRFRLRIVPGITGWGRLLGSPPSDPEKQRIELQRDLFYIRYADLSFDLAITFNAFIRGARELINSLIRINASHYQSNS